MVCNIRIKIEELNRNFLVIGMHRGKRTLNWRGVISDYNLSAIIPLAKT